MVLLPWLVLSVNCTIFLVKSAKGFLYFDPLRDGVLSVMWFFKLFIADLVIMYMYIPPGWQVSMLRYTYSHKSLRKVQSAHLQSPAWLHFHFWPSVWFGDLKTEYSMVIHDTECPYWDQASLNNTDTNACDNFVWDTIGYKNYRMR